MSESSQGSGWWLASDGRWYPPELAANPAPPPIQPPAWVPPSQPPVADASSPAAARPLPQTSSDEDEGGRGTFGDGQMRPLYEFQASRFKGGRLFTPNVIRVWPDRIEEYEHHAVRRKGTQSISFQQVAEVTLARGLVWSDVGVESSGGKTITMRGVPKADGERVKKLIDDAVSSTKHGPAAPTVVVPDVADQIRKLATLRDEGLLTDDEFAAQKAKLLS